MKNCLVYAVYAHVVRSLSSRPSPDFYIGDLPDRRLPAPRFPMNVNFQRGGITDSSFINAVSFSQPAIRSRRSPRPKDRCEKFYQFVDGRVETPKRPVGLRDGCSCPARALSHNRENCMRRVASRNGYTMHSSRSHDAVIRVYDAAGKVIETHEHAGER